MGSGGSPPSLTNAFWVKAALMPVLEPSHAAAVSVYLPKKRSFSCTCVELRVPRTLRGILGMRQLAHESN